MTILYFDMYYINPGVIIDVHGMLGIYCYIYILYYLKAGALELTGNYKTYISQQFQTRNLNDFFKIIFP